MRREDAKSVVDACADRVAAEDGYIARYYDGETPLTVSGLDKVLASKG